ncbi:cupin domain-containing protein [Telluribacter sp. SYSU D00476]|uniref:cupin domain-containing protein n=1 Tax=Telluribacter sp. SYSU D00476 TaxID=2811430 RepID=UPI001FF4DA31|nr:cupin domain-containing protein [Telluribacter sp. SYSU D00476]
MDVQAAPAYLLRAGEGKKLYFGGAEISVIASPEQTNELLEVVEIFASGTFYFPAHFHQHTHKGIYVLSGEVLLSFKNKTYHLRKGDYGHIPRGVTHILRTVEPNTRLLCLTGPGGVVSLFTQLALNQAFQKEPLYEVSDKVDFQLVDEYEPARHVQEVENMDRPNGTKPYVIRNGGGEHFIVEDQLFSFLARQNNTDGQFLVLMTDGPKGKAIIEHYHKRHTECFYCLEGSMTMWNEGQAVALNPRDFLHIPAHTKHTYRLDSPNTRFIGFLAPGLFEPFFDALGTPYYSHVVPTKPGPARFDRVLKNYDKLDLYFVSPPPDGSMNAVQAAVVSFSFWLSGKLTAKK